MQCGSPILSVAGLVHSAFRDSSRPGSGEIKWGNAKAGGLRALPGDGRSSDVWRGSGAVARIYSGIGKNPARLGSEVPRHSRPGRIARLHAAPFGPAAP